MNVPNVPLQKAIETEKQIINLALYNKRTVSMLVEIDSDEFFIDHLRKIKYIINDMVSANKSVSPTSVYNEILDKELQNSFTDIAVQQYLGDADTIFDQFKKYHRIIKLQPVIAELWDMSQTGNINFDEKFDELSDLYSTSKVVQEATMMADLMRINMEDVRKSFTRFKSGIPSLDAKIKWLYGGQYITIAAAPGCISGDTQIRFNRAGKGFKKNIREARDSFHNIGKKDSWWDRSIKTYVRSFNGKTIQLHEIENIVYSGMKCVIMVTLSDGRSIKLTPDHKILTSNGWVEAGRLSIHDDVMIDGVKPKKILDKYNKKRDKEVYNIPHHPYAIKKFDIRRGASTNRISIHRLIYESVLNNLDIDDYIDCLRNYPDVCKGFTFIDPSVFHIHHKDGNHNNNDPDNLIQMTINEHLKLHSETCRFNFNQGNPSFLKVISKTQIGIVDTYDIICKDPYRNFSANDIIIHNSGKTTMGINIALNIPDSLLMSYEMSAEEIHDIIISRHTNIDSEKFEDGNLEYGEKKIVETARRELSNSLTLRICDKNLSLSDLMAFIKASVHKYKIKCVIIDYAQIVPGLKGKGTQTEKYEDLSRRFKLLARELKIIVIALSQLNKSSLSENRAPNLSDLRGSLSFGADADKVIFLYEIPTENGVQCALGKNRKGKMGKVYEFYYNKSVHFMR